MEKTFELKSFKIGVCGVDCKYRQSVTDEDGIITENEYHVKVSRPIHSDLRNLFEVNLRDITANVFNNTEDIAAIELGESRIFPTGVVFAGKNDNEGLSILGERRTKFGDVVFKTPRIKFKTSDTDVAAKLTVFAELIKSEVYAYLFMGKTEELSTFGE